MAVKKLKKLKNNKGFASIEAIAMLFIIVVLLNFTVGSFGAVHTGILNSIAARAYLFEIMDHRADLNYLRSHPEAFSGAGPHRTSGFRYSGISSEHQQGEARFLASSRNIDFSEYSDDGTSDSVTQHARVQELNLSKRATRGVDNVWVKVVYGICMNTSCGGIQ